MSLGIPRVIDFGRVRPPIVLLKAIGIGMVILVGALLWNCVYTVGPEEVGVVQTFGRYSRLEEPGLCFKWTWPIENVTKVPGAATA